MDWHLLKQEEVFSRLQTTKNGLSTSQAQDRLERYGPNKIIFRKKISALAIFISQFANLLILVLVAAAALAFLIGFLPEQEPRVIDSLLILAIVLANGIFGFFQDYKAEKSIESLKKLATPQAEVLRDGIPQEVNAQNLVPGDIIFLSPGKKVPADSRIIESQNLASDQSMLTGESNPSSKSQNQLQEDVAIAERKNMLYANTLVVRGRGKALVTGTGTNTEFGKIAHELQETPDIPSQLKIEVSRLGRKLGLLIFVVIALIFFIQFLTKTIHIFEIILTSISLAVAAIPEGLPAIVTLSLAFGTRKMLSQKTLVSKLSVVESLGSVDLICTDKTGTLTENMMTVREIFFNSQRIEIKEDENSSLKKFMFGNEEVNPKVLSPILECGLFCNNVQIGKDESGKEKAIGDPTEAALLRLAHEMGLKKEDVRRIDEIPFSSERKMMTTLEEKDKTLTVYAKGAPEVILELCDKIYENGKEKPLTQIKKEEILTQNWTMSERALRVLAFATKPLEKPEKSQAEKNLVFLGLQGMIDPPRKEIKEAIRLAHQAGIRTVMVTGDNHITAQAIASEIGLGQKSCQAQELDQMTDEDLRHAVEEIDIFSRISPTHKVRILKALQKNDHVVAMTGDGVNDAPALKSADVGIAMGQRGTDVAKQTSDLIILDDNYATILQAVKEGRTIFSNIRNFVNYLLTTNFAEVAVVFVVSLFGLLAIKPVQILWINLLTDSFPALALGIDPVRQHIMERRPRPKGEGIINKRVAWLIVTIGSKKTLILLVIFFIGLQQNLVVAQTMAFTGFILYEFVRLTVIRHQDQLGFFSNKWLILAMGLSISLQLIVLYSPLRHAFGVATLGVFEWTVLVIGMVVAWFLAILISKAVVKFS